MIWTKIDYFDKVFYRDGFSIRYKRTRRYFLWFVISEKLEVVL